jgi:hypothetical protein
MEQTLAAKRTLFDAAVGDSDVDSLDRTTLASRIATILSDSYAASTGPAAQAHVPGASSVVDPVEELRARLGEGVESIARGRDGRMVVIVSDGVAVPPSDDRAIYFPSSATSALAALGASSPLAGADVIHESSKPSPSPERLRARSCLAAAERKLAAARSLAASAEASEALPLLHGALALVIRALAPREVGDDPASLLAVLYSELLPGGLVTAADAHAYSRSGELARAFALSAVPPPARLVQDLIAECADLVARSRERHDGAPIAPPPPALPAARVAAALPPN